MSGPSLCEACERGDHANCGRQSWCDCDCEGAVDALDVEPETYLDDVERYGEREERVDSQTGFVDD